jgi:tetratricopeptide (TPR) repeat protein
MRLTASPFVYVAAVLLAGLVGFAGREAWAQAAPAPAAPASTAPTPDQLMATAQQQLRAGDRAGAIAPLRAAVALDPKHGSAGLLITTLHQDDRVEEAYAIGDRYRREGPRNPRALFRFGWVLAFTGEIARAEALYRDLVVLDQGGIYEAWGNGELSYLARARGEPAPIVLGWAYRLLGDEALQLAARTPSILLYGAPDPHDRMFDSLVGAPEYEALLQRSRSKVDAERKRLGWGAL